MSARPPIQGVLNLPDGQSILFDLSELEAVQSDWVGYAARHHGTSRETFAAWIDYMQSHCRCNGITRSGGRCLKRGQEYPEPATFRPGATDRCRVHAGALETPPTPMREAASGAQHTIPTP
jgi:hypothetical protein